MELYNVRYIYIERSLIRYSKNEIFLFSGWLVCKNHWSPTVYVFPP